MTDESVRQQLAAILAADVVSYSSQMERDEQGTLARVKAVRDQVIAPAVADRGGRIFKTMGDGFLSIFPAAAAAVESALAIQKEMADRHADETAGEQLQLRVGVNLGDVLVDGEDVYGDGVNVAARLEALAEPGGVCISGAAHDTLRGDLGQAFTEGGVPSLKNISRPIHVWHWRAAGGAVPAQSAGATGNAGTAPTLAILPFTCTGASAEAADIADGIADDLTNIFARRTGVQILAAGMRPALRQAGSDLAALRDLGVDYVLTGALRQSGQRVRASAELLETAGGRQVWSERYDRELDDPFELQDELAGVISMAVRTAMNAYEGSMFDDGSPETLTDEQCRAKASEHFYHFTSEDFLTAGRYLDTVLARNPRDAIALAMKAFSLGFGSLTGIHPMPEEGMAELAAMTEQAVQLNKTSDYTYMVRGLTKLMVMDDPHGAVADARRSLEISPHYAIAIALLGDALGYTGETEEGMALLRKAIEANPQDPVNFARYWMLSMHLFGREEYEDALREIERALQQSHELPAFFLAKAAILQQLGRLDEARTVVVGLKQRYPDATTANIHQPRYTDLAIRTRYLDALKAAGLDD